MALERRPPGDWSQEDFETEVPLVRAAEYDAVVTGLDAAVAALKRVHDFYWPPDPDIPGETEIMAEVHAVLAVYESGKDSVNGDKS